MMTLWDKFWSAYLVWSIRICCYASGFYLFSAFAEAFYKPFPILADAVVLFYGMGCSELAARIVKRWYQPGFVCEDGIKNRNKDGRLVVSRQAYEYRKKAEIVICELLVFFAVNFILALVLLAIMPSSQIQIMVAGGLCGLIAAFFSFIGAVLMVVRSENSAAKQGIAIFRILGFGALLPAYFYIAYAVKRFILS